MMNKSVDNIPTMLAEGEYVIPADVVKHKGVEFFDRITGKTREAIAKQKQAIPVDGSVRGMNTGGAVYPYGPAQQVNMGGDVMQQKTAQPDALQIQRQGPQQQQQQQGGPSVNPQQVMDMVDKYTNQPKTQTTAPTESAPTTTPTTAATPTATPAATAAPAATGAEAAPAVATAGGSGVAGGGGSGAAAGGGMAGGWWAAIAAAIVANEADADKRGNRAPIESWSRWRDIINGNVVNQDFAKGGTWDQRFSDWFGSGWKKTDIGGVVSDDMQTFSDVQPTSAVKDPKKFIETSTLTGGAPGQDPRNMVKKVDKALGGSGDSVTAGIGKITGANVADSIARKTDELHGGSGDSVTGGLKAATGIDIAQRGMQDTGKATKKLASASADSIVKPAKAIGGALKNLF